MIPADALTVQKFLRRSMNMRVATLSTRGVPHITPLRFIPDEGTIYTLTRAGSPAARHISARPGVVLLFDAEQKGSAAQFLRIRAVAAVRSESHLRQSYERRAALKYFLRPGGIWNMLTHVRSLGVWVRGLRDRTPANLALIEFVPQSAEFLPGVPGG